MSSKFTWFEGRLVEEEKALLPFMTSSLHYGTAVFEGIRAYSTDGGPAVFRLKDHMRRLYKSAEILGFRDLPYSPELLYDAVLELVRVNKLEDCYIRPLIYIREGGWSLSVDNTRLEASIAAFEWRNYLGGEALNNGVRANVSSYPRHHQNIAMTKGKIAGNYVNSVLAKTESIRAGFDEAIMLDLHGNVSECTGENIFVVREGVIYTPPKNTVLEGITRDTVIRLARDKGYNLVEEELTRDQLYVADEVFVSGTAAEVIALREIDHRRIGRGSMGPVCADLQQAYHQLIHGRLPGYDFWLDRVYAKAAMAG